MEVFRQLEDLTIILIRNSRVDVVISHLGMFKDTLIPTLSKIYNIFKSEGVFILVYPRFWT